MRLPRKKFSQAKNKFSNEIIFKKILCPISSPPPRRVLLFYKIYDLLCFWYIHTKKIPKFDRYTIGEKIFSILLSLVVQISRAEYMKPCDKLPLLLNLSPELDCLKILMRLTNTLEIINEPLYIKMQTELQEIGKMLGGWINSLEVKQKSWKTGFLLHFSRISGERRAIVRVGIRRIPPVHVRAIRIAIADIHELAIREFSHHLSAEKIWLPSYPANQTFQTLKNNRKQCGLLLFFGKPTRKKLRWLYEPKF